MTPNTLVAVILVFGMMMAYIANLNGKVSKLTKDNEQLQNTTPPSKLPPKQQRE